MLGELGRWVASCAPAHTIALVTDTHVAPHWLEPALSALSSSGAARVLWRAMPAGEASKTREQWAALTDWMLAEGCGRDTTVVALGGGVVGDLAGFVAATYMRGVPVVQVPTTLLAMVDASIGGKTGVDTPAGKNLVGAFHPPSAVVADPLALATLPARELRAGMAEVLKHGAIADLSYFERAAAWCADTSARLGSGEFVEWDAPALEAIVAQSVAIKAEIVRADPREAGRRQVLNAGHTVAHALELATDFGVAHGEAVAIGLVVEARLAEDLAVAEPGTADQLRQAIAQAGLPHSLPDTVRPESVHQAMGSDKKRRGGHAAFSLLRSVGRAAGDDLRGWSIVVEADTVLRVLRAASTAQ